MDGKIRINTELEEKTFEKQYQELEQKLKIMQKTLETDNEVPIHLRLSDDERIKLESDIEKVKNRMFDMSVKMNDIGNESTPVSDKMSANFSKITNSIKKIGFSLLSIRGAYSILSKASSSYLSTDDKTTKQIQANWMALGTVLAPIIQGITDFIKKAVTAILYFIDQLTGSNNIANANANILKKQTKATKDLTNANKKAAASFDEMNIAQDNSTSVGGIGSDVTASLFDVNDLGENVKSTIDEIANALKPVYEFIKDIIKWCLEHPDIILPVLGGIAIISIISKIIGVGSTGLVGVYAILLLIAAVTIAGVVEETKELLKAIEEKDKAMKDNEEIVLESVKNTQKQSKEVKELIKTNKLAEDGYKIGAKALSGMNKEELTNIKRMMSQQKEILKSGNMVRIIGGEYDNLNYNIQGNTMRMGNNLTMLVAMAQQGKLNDDEMKELNDTLLAYSEVLKYAGVNNETLNQMLESGDEASMQFAEDILYLNDNIELLPDGKTVKINGVTEEAEKNIENVQQNIDNLPKTTTVNLDANTKSFNQKISSAFNGVASFLSNVTGIKINVPTFKSAKGSIINNPGRGIPVGGNVIGGEVSKEGVLPLTDGQVMEELGSTIAKYVNITIDNTVKLDNRTIQRTQSKTQAEKNFAMNR